MGKYTEPLYEAIVAAAGDVAAVAAVPAAVKDRHTQPQPPLRPGGGDVLEPPVGKKALVAWYGGVAVMSETDPGTGLRASRTRDSQKTRVTFGGSSLHSLVHAPHALPGAWPAVDPTEFPAFYQAKAYEFVVLPGDTLYIPGKYWHWVRARAWAAGPGSLPVARHRMPGSLRSFASWRMVSWVRVMEV
jgi:hypothetical protein